MTISCNVEDNGNFQQSVSFKFEGITKEFQAEIVKDGDELTLISEELIMTDVTLSDGSTTKLIALRNPAIRKGDRKGLCDIAEC